MYNIELKYTSFNEFVKCIKMLLDLKGIDYKIEKQESYCSNSMDGTGFMLIWNGQKMQQPVSCARMIVRETSTHDDVIDNFMEAEVDEIVEMINTVFMMKINNANGFHVEALMYHTLGYLESKLSWHTNSSIVGDNWTLADIFTHVFLGGIEKDVLENYPNLNLYLKSNSIGT